MPPPQSVSADPVPVVGDGTLGEDHGDPGAGSQAAWTYSVSVRSLCEFTAKAGDLDRRFTPSATALEGLLGQSAVVARRGPGYESELPLEGRSGSLRVRGRADGYDAARNCLEEIKTLRGHPDDIPENRRHLHWAQLETYGALICRQRDLPEVHLALVYFDAATQTETVLRELRSATELDIGFEARCRRFAGWADQEAAHRAARDAALSALPFPPGEFRPGQRALAEAVYRAAVNARCLLAQAPTGIGKTIGTLYPLLRAMPGQRLDKIGYLTCKGTGRITALEALQQLRRTMVGRSLRVLALVAKEQACEHPDKACHGESCPLARGFYDRLPAARAEAVKIGWQDAPAQRQIALGHGICPYYLGQELLRWADVVVGDVHHAFDPKGQLFGLSQALDWRLGLLVDEAHNLVERARRMYSAAISLQQIRAAMAVAPALLRPRFSRLLQVATPVATQAAGAQDIDYQVFDAVPDELGEALMALNAALGEHLQDQPAATGPLLDFYFESSRFQRVVERFGAHSLFDVQRPLAMAVSAGPYRSRAATGTDALVTANLSLLEQDLGSLAITGSRDTDPVVADRNFDADLSIRNVVPGAFLRARFAACHTAILFSATLAPQAYQHDLLGLPENTAWIDVPSAFAPGNLVVRVADRLSTRYPHREASLDAIVNLMARQFDEQPGNYLAFFSSFDYLAQAATRLGLRHPGVPQWRQSRAMDSGAREAFLGRFVRDGRGIGFAVLGGAFAEGVDLPGTRLIGAFIATLGLPPVSPVRHQFRLRLDALYGPGHGYADRVPGMQKVVQAAGRVLRSPEDRGWLWLMDGRYRRPEVLALMPQAWHITDEAR